MGPSRATTGRVEVLGSYLVGTAILLSAALWSGYPLIYSDTGVYVASGFELFVSNDRPIVYGLFVRIASAGASLWGVVAVQSALLFFAIVKALEVFFDRAIARRWALAAVALLSVTTGLTWYSGQVSPDIFTAVAMLSLSSLLLSASLSMVEKILLAVLFVFASAVHLSNLVLDLVLLAGLSLGWWVFRAKGRELPATGSRIALAWALAAAAWLAVASVHAVFGGGFRLSRSTHVFLVGRLLESGVLKRYLDEACTTRRYTLCSFKDSLPNLETFLWDPTGPPARAGGWDATREEYRQIFRGVLSRPRFIGSLVADGALVTMAQLTHNAPGAGLIQFSADAYVMGKLARHFGAEFPRYLSSRQNGEPCCGGSRGGGTLRSISSETARFSRSSLLESRVVRADSTQSAVLGLCLVLTVAFFAARLDRALQARTVAFLVFVLGALFANAAVTANLGTVCDRYSGRLVWIFPLALLVVASKEGRVVRMRLRGINGRATRRDTIERG